MLRSFIDNTSLLQFNYTAATTRYFTTTLLKDTKLLASYTLRRLAQEVVCAHVGVSSLSVIDFQSVYSLKFKLLISGKQVRMLICVFADA